MKNATPKLQISIAPAPLGELLSDGYKEEADALLDKAEVAVAAHDDLVGALQAVIEAGRMSDHPRAVYCADIARAALAKIEN
jgi:hypothetical protein